jgi:hypothetical protein
VPPDYVYPFKPLEASNQARKEKNCALLISQVTVSDGYDGDLLASLTSGVHCHVRIEKTHGHY